MTTSATCAVSLTCSPLSSLCFLFSSQHESAMDGSGHLPVHRGLLCPVALHPLHLTEEVCTHLSLCTLFYTHHRPLTDPRAVLVSKSDARPCQV